MGRAFQLTNSDSGEINVNLPEPYSDTRGRSDVKGGTARLQADLLGA
jgi:hypothetical protein